jgi:small multidrug resistance family-3 protein
LQNFEKPGHCAGLFVWGPRVTFLLFFAAAIFEIGGCYLIWLAVRQDQPWLWLPALAALGLFGYLLSLTGMDSAGRVFAIYGGIYILASIAFMAGFEGIRPDRWDMLGAALALTGAAIIFFAPRG